MGRANRKERGALHCCGCPRLLLHFILGLGVLCLTSHVITIQTQGQRTQSKEDQWLDKVVLRPPPSSTAWTNTHGPPRPLPRPTTTQMPVLPQSARRLLLLLLLLLLATTTAALPPPPPFQVPTPYGTLAYNVIEESRVLFLKLTTRGRSSFIPSSVGPIHVLRCPGKRGATLPPVMLVHGVCATGT